jgi:hypothetical protein
VFSRRAPLREGAAAELFEVARIPVSQRMGEEIRLDRSQREHGDVAILLSRLCNAQREVARLGLSFRLVVIRLGLPETPEGFPRCSDEERQRSGLRASDQFPRSRFAFAELHPVDAGEGQLAWRHRARKCERHPPERCPEGRDRELPALEVTLHVLEGPHSGHRADAGRPSLSARVRSPAFV